MADSAAFFKEKLKLLQLLIGKYSAKQLLQLILIFTIRQQQGDSP